MANTAHTKMQGFPSPQADHRHEQKDVNVRALLFLAVTLLVIAFILHTGAWWLMNFYNNHPSAVPNAPTSPLARTQQIPPLPRLQESPQSDLTAYRDAEEAALHGYGWADRNQNRVRIPIEQAKDLFLKENQPAPNTAGGNVR